VLNGSQVPIAEPPDVLDVDTGLSQGKRSPMLASRPKDYNADRTADSSISLTVKSLKPSLSITVTARLTDTVSDLKNLVAKSSSSAPPPDTQRLLLKGKALTDTKLLKEYDIESGATIHLILKAAPSVNPTTPSPASPAAPSPDPPSNRPPSLMITTSMDDSSAPGMSMPLSNTDIAAPPLGPQPQVSSAAFHHTISDPRFWQQIHALCVGEFDYEDDADSAWESFLISMKGRLSAGEAAKIRDVVGVKGESLDRHGMIS